MLLQGVPGGHFDGLGAAFKAAVIKFNSLAAAGEFKLPGHGIRNAGQVREDMAPCPARQQ
ncbi:hypothetical protein D9M72_596440 [compost metagenome]